MDVNEEIVKEWLHICKKQFTLENIRFKVYGSKGGSNYSDIDILAVDKDGNYYDYEIKWRSVYSLGATDKESIDAFIKQVLRKERIEKILSHHTGQSLDKIKKDTDRDYFMPADEAKSYGIVDSVVETIKKKK